VKRCLGLGVGALLLAACQAPLRPPLPAAQAPTPGAATQAPAAAQSVADLAAAVQADARRADRESDANARTRLADAAAAMRMRASLEPRRPAPVSTPGRSPWGWPRGPTRSRPASY